MLLRSLCACVLVCGSVSAADRLVPIPDPISTPTASTAAVSGCEDEWAAIVAAINSYSAAATDYVLSLTDWDTAQAELDFCELNGGDCSVEEADAIAAAAAVDAATNAWTAATLVLTNAQGDYDACILLNGGSGNHEILAPIQWQIMSIR